jgi:Glycosidases
MKKTLALLVATLALVACNKPQEGNFTNVQHPDWVKNAVLYEVNVRQYTPEGTFAALEQHLDRLSDLGVDVLWIMPMHPIGVEGRKGTLGSYYSPNDYTDVNPEFGTIDDFKHFLDTAHEKGFKVILDWVANHTGRDSKWALEHPEWYYQDSLGNLAVQYDWTDIAHLNYQYDEQRQAMFEALKYWVDMGVDGFRCDVAAEVPLDFWESSFDKLRAENPELFFLAEAENAPLQKNAFDAFYSWQQMHVWYDLAAGKIDADSLANFYVVRQEVSEMPLGTIPMNFTSNHDQNSWHGTDREDYGDAAKQFAVLSFVVPGTPMIYTGQEASLDKRLEFFEKDPVDWSNDFNDMTSLYKDLIHLRDVHSCLWAQPWGGVMAILPTDHPQQIFAFERESEGDMCLAMFNFSDETVSYKVENHLVTKDSDFTLPPHGYHIIFSVGDCFGDCDGIEVDIPQLSQGEPAQPQEQE